MTCSGSVFQMRSPATGKGEGADGGQKNSPDDQVVGSRGPESVARRDSANSDTDELPQILRYVAGKSTVRQDGNLYVMRSESDTRKQCKLTSASVM